MNTATKKRLLLLFPALLLALGGCDNVGSNSSDSDINTSGGNTSSVSDEYIDPSLPKDERGLSPMEYALFNLVGTDGLGRQIERQNGYREGMVQKVGLFYHTWLGQEQKQGGIYDVSYLLSTEEGREALASDTPTNELSPQGQFHFWGQPLYGYYNASDPYVLARHVELFIEADIDYLVIDATNRAIYGIPTNTLLETLKKFKDQGFDVPKVCFYTNSFSASTAWGLYNQFYQDPIDPDLWFTLDGYTPVLIAVTEDNGTASDTAAFPGQAWMYEPLTRANDAFLFEFFDIRESQWPNTGYEHPNSMPWMDWHYPQTIHEQTKAVAVPVAQHSHSVTYVSSGDPECSRGYNPETGEVDEEWWRGQALEMMFDSVIERRDQIENIMVTGWGEWIAIKQPANADGPFWVDVYNNEFSRDIEMSKDPLLQDHFYMQLIRKVRELKMTPYVKYAKPIVNIDVRNGVDPKWDNVISAYADVTGDAIKRDFQAAATDLRYTDDSARNDIKLVKVAEDKENLYFYIECASDITPHTTGDSTYMNILINTNSGNDSFCGFDYRINGDLNGTIGSVERSTGGYNWERVGDATTVVDGHVMQVAIPKTAINYLDGRDISFKVTDHITHPDDIMDYYVSGDAMPLGRIGYGY